MFRINNKKYIIWVRTTKTGSTSLKAYLGDSNKKWKDDIEELKILNIKKHYGHYNQFLYPSNKMCIDMKENYINIIPQMRIKEFIEEYKNVWDDSFKFILTRNPYDKFLSGWKFLNSDKISRQILKNTPFNEMDNFNYDKFSPHLKNHIIDEIYFEDIKSVDYIVKYENYINDIEKLFNLINIPFNKKNYPNVRKTQFTDYKEYYMNNKNMIEFVDNKFKNDFEFFGYDKFSK